MMGSEFKADPELPLTIIQTQAEVVSANYFLFFRKAVWVIYFPLFGYFLLAQSIGFRSEFSCPFSVNGDSWDSRLWVI
jgi:hypothetical protein